MSSFLSYLLLTGFSNIGQERSASSLYHILRGKKSAQSIQDTHLFQLHALFRTIPKLSRTMFHEGIAVLEKNSWIDTDEETVIVTPAGQNHVALMPQPTTSGLRFFDIQAEWLPFWRRLTLLVQVFSHDQHNVKTYYPIQRDENTLRWVKGFIREQTDRTRAARQCADELTRALRQMDELNVALFVEQLSGWKQTGKTTLQLSQERRIDPLEVRFRLYHVLSELLLLAEKERQHFPFLANIRPARATPLTQSAKQTLALYTQEIPLEEIAKRRQLRISTIEDHIVEIACSLPSFPIEKHISTDLQKKITHAKEEVNSVRLKAVKERVPEATYFQIRLLLSSANQR